MGRAALSRAASAAQAAEAAERAGPQVAGDAAAASRVAESTHLRRGGWALATVRYHGAILAAVRTAGVDGSCRLGAPDQGKAVETPRVGRRAGWDRESAPAETIDPTVVPRGHPRPRVAPDCA